MKRLFLILILGFILTACSDSEYEDQNINHSPEYIKPVYPPNNMPQPTTSPSASW